MKPQYIVIHHSLTPDGETVNWQAIRKYHKEVKGWESVAYHMGLEKVGDHYEALFGRMHDQPGAHALGFNDNSLGICCIGNFDLEPMPTEQFSLLLKITKSLMYIHNIPASNVIGHRETYAMRGLAIVKSCPGWKLDLIKFREILK